MIVAFSPFGPNNQSLLYYERERERERGGREGTGGDEVGVGGARPKHFTRCGDWFLITGLND